MVTPDVLAALRENAVITTGVPRVRFNISSDDRLVQQTTLEPSNSQDWIMSTSEKAPSPRIRLVPKRSLAVLTLKVVFTKQNRET